MINRVNILFILNLALCLTIGHYGMRAYGQEQILNVNKTNAISLNDSGIEHFNAGRFDKAIEFYKKALKTTQNDILTKTTGSDPENGKLLTSFCVFIK